jgi:transcriptional regulator with XRE-family HTH domain
MFEQVASTLGLSTSALAAKLGIARRTVTRKRGNGAPLSSETSEKLLRVARVRNLGRALVRLKQTNDIQPFHAFSAEVPDSLILKPDSFPARWKSRLAVSRAFGNAWLEAKTMPAMLVPTVITPGEWNVLINPLRPEFSLKWIVSGPDAYSFDTRLLPVKKKSR